MGNTIIAPVGDNPQALFVGMKEFPTQRVYLITPRDNMKTALKLKEKLADFTIPCKIIDVELGSIEEMFKAFGEIVALHDVDDIIVNVATGDRMSTCAALSASYANGLRAFGVDNAQVMLLPIMKLSYYNELSENKMKLLHNLDDVEFITLKNLSEQLKMSISLVSYHINGNYKYKGLKEFRMVETMSKNKNMYMRLSKMGKLLLNGYIKKQEKK